MKILSIESSCDETSAAVVEKKNAKLSVLAHVTATSLFTHAKTGGIIPENAAREQVKYIIPVIVEALNKSHKKKTLQSWKTARQILQNDIDALAVTYGPGLIGSLLVGVETVKTLSYVFNKPLIPVHHLLAHIFANFVVHNHIQYPFIGLVVSGGHTDLLYVTSATTYSWLGGTRDDAAGECFDKCARLLGFAYPGGPTISKLAEKGNAKNISLPKLMKDKNFDFSFSGLKTAFMNVVKKEFNVYSSPNKKGYSWIHTSVEALPEAKQQLLYDLCASLEQTIVEVLVRKTLNAAEKYNCKTVLLGGGVSANHTLLEKLYQEATIRGKKINIFSPPQEYCTDNAVMIGAYALLNYKPENIENVHATPELYFA